MKNEEMKKKTEIYPTKIKPAIILQLNPTIIIKRK